MPSRIVVRRLLKTDQKEFVAAVRRSSALHRVWVRAPSTAAQYHTYLQRQDGRSHWAFLVCRRDTGALAGVINISNAVRGSFHSAYLGYYAFTPHDRQGLMREGLQAVVRHAFGTLKLHRLEANIQPGNVASIALARACGFRKEGFSPRYLKIAGRWRDHERWAIVADR
jgi:ribosomal-protein-alanine N-acetyltransferase